MESEIEQFLAHDAIEKGLSPNTVAAYATDIRQFHDFLAASMVSSWRNVNRKLILDFLDAGYNEELSSASIARKLVTIRCFCGTSSRKE